MYFWLLPCSILSDSNSQNSKIYFKNQKNYIPKVPIKRFSLKKLLVNTENPNKTLVGILLVYYWLLTYSRN